MKKFIKSKLFFFIIGFLVSSTVVVISAPLDAADIEYKNNKTVKNELDDLLEQSDYETYSATTELTPNSSNHSLSTENKILNSDITIKKVPDYYKILTETTTATAADVMSGKKIYDSNGSLITGTISGNPNCKYDSFTCTTCNTSTGQTMSLDFTPNRIVFFSVDINNWFAFYDKAKSTTTLYPNYPLNTYVGLGTKSMTIKNFDSSNIGKTFLYYYCK